MRIDITRDARSDLEDIHDHLEAQREGLGKTMVLRFQQSLKRIEQFPRRYAKQFGSIRVCPLKRMKIGIYYRLRRDRVEIGAVVDLRRDPAFIARKLRSL